MSEPVPSQIHEGGTALVLQSQSGAFVPDDQWNFQGFGVEVRSHVNKDSVEDVSDLIHLANREMDVLAG